MSITIKYDKILDELREGDSVPDPLFVDNLGVRSLASINIIYANNLVASGATISTAQITNINWNLLSGATLTPEGQMNWSSNLGTAVLGLAGGNVDVSLGLETVFPTRVRNSTGTAMPKGTVVYINGSSGNTPTVDRALAIGDSTSAFTLGMTAETINNNAIGWITTFGEISGIDLSTYSIGDTLYLSGATAGLFTNIVPSAPTHYVRVGTVVKATTDGSLVVNVINGFEVKELHDVQITSLASGDILRRDGTLWKNVSPLYMNYFGEHNIDPTGISPINGDQYWNNLDERMQVYINRWRELNGADRFQFTNGDDFQFTDTRYFQFTR